MVLWLQPQNKATINPMEDAIVKLSKKMTSGQIKHQNNADLLF